MMRASQNRTETLDNDKMDAKTAAAQRILNLLFILNATSAPIPTSQIIADSDLGYGSGNPESDKRKFNRDREALAAQGVVIRDMRPQGSSKTDEGFWALDRESTFAAGGLLDTESVETLLKVVDLELENPNSPFLIPARRIRAKLLELTGTNPNTAPDTQATAAEEAVWSAFSLKKTLRFTYRNARGDKKNRSCCIYGIFSDRGIGYFVGLDDISGEIRTFRIDRVVSAKKPGRAYEIPQGFSVRDYFFLPFDFTENNSTKAVFGFPSQRTEAELRAFTLDRGTLELGESQTRWLWTVEVADLSTAARYALAHTHLEPEPLEPQALIDAWNCEIDKAVSAHAC